MSSIARLMQVLGNVASRAQLIQGSITAVQIERALQSGELERIRRGVYASAAASADQRRAAYIGGRMTCATAAATYGIWAGSDRRLHLAVPRNASRLRLGPADIAADVVIHYRKVDQATPELWRVPLAQCLRDTVRCADVETARAALDTAVTSRLITVNGIRDAFAGEPQRSRAIASLARFGSDSGVESIVRQRLTALALDVRQQVVVPGVGRVDLLIEGILFVEIDGFAFHSSAGDFDRDRRRDAAFVTQGLTRLRFTANDVLFEWTRVQETVLAALAAIRRRAYSGSLEAEGAKSVGIRPRRHSSARSS